MPRSYTLVEAYRRMYATESVAAIGQGLAVDAMFSPGYFKDEYQNAILQGYTPEQAQAKALAVVSADMMAGLSANALTGLISDPVKATGIGAPLAFVADLAINGGAGILTAQQVGDAWDRQNEMGKYNPEGGKAYYSDEQRATVDYPFKDADVDRLFNAGMDKVDPEGKAQRATQQRTALGVVAGGNAGYTVLKDRKEGEDDNAYKIRMAQAEKLADKLNKENGLGQYRTNANADDAGQTGDEENNNENSDNTEDQTGDQTGDTDNEDKVTDDKEEKDTFDVATKPGESMKAKQDRLLQNKDYKDLTPTQQWAINHPHLAAKVKPGSAGYDEIQKVSEYIKDKTGKDTVPNQQQQQNNQSPSTAGDPPPVQSATQNNKVQAQPKTEAQKAAEAKRKQEEQMARQRQQAAQRQAQLQRQQAMGTQRTQQQAVQRQQAAARAQQQAQQQAQKQQQQPGIQPPAAQNTPGNALKTQFQQRRTQIANQNANMAEGLLDYLLQ